VSRCGQVIFLSLSIQFEEDYKRNLRSLDLLDGIAHQQRRHVYRLSSGIRDSLSQCKRVPSVPSKNLIALLAANYDFDAHKTHCCVSTVARRIKLSVLR
jgi:hypothetical protein